MKQKNNISYEYSIFPTIKKRPLNKKTLEKEDLLIYTFDKNKFSPSYKIFRELNNSTKNEKKIISSSHFKNTKDDLNLLTLKKSCLSKSKITKNDLKFQDLVESREVSIIRRKSSDFSGFESILNLKKSYLETFYKQINQLSSYKIPLSKELFFSESEKELLKNIKLKKNDIKTQLVEG